MVSPKLHSRTTIVTVQGCLLLSVEWVLYGSFSIHLAMVWRLCRVWRVEEDLGFINRGFLLYSIASLLLGPGLRKPGGSAVSGGEHLANFPHILIC